MTASPVLSCWMYAEQYFEVLGSYDPLKLGVGLGFGVISYDPNVSVLLSQL